MNMDSINFFAEDLKVLQLNINDKQMEQFHQYFDLIISANNKINLTAITERNEVNKKHFIDSLCLIKYIDCAENIFNVIDVGTGAGFPGIPLKIVYPHLKLTLLDSINKRVDFLNKVIIELGLSDIEALHGRAEDFSHQSDFRENYDLCVSRAVANLSTLSEYCLPFVKPGGLFIAYKTKISTEVAEAGNSVSLLGGEFDKQISFALPNSDISRTLIGIKKINQTPEKYPRRAGMPSKKPL